MKSMIMLGLAASFLLSTNFAYAKKETISVDLKASQVQWTASKLVGATHNGEVQVKSGTIEMENGVPVSAKVTIDMNSITDKDLTDKKWNAKLVNHLKSDDFFSVQKFPTAELEAKKLHHVKDGVFQVRGTLTIRGKSQPVAFTAQVKKQRGQGDVITANLEIDRTDFDVKYGSGKFFEGLGDKIIDDKFKLETKIVLEKAAIKTAFAH